MRCTSNLRRASSPCFSIGVAEQALEARFLAQQTGHEEMKQRPQLAQMVFQRRAGQAQAVPRANAAHHFRRLGARVLDILRFVQDQQVIGLRQQRGFVAGK